MSRRLWSLSILAFILSLTASRSGLSFRMTIPNSIIKLRSPRLSLLRIDADKLNNFPSWFVFLRRKSRKTQKVRIKMISKLFKLVAVLAIALMALSADGCPQEAPQSFVSQNGLLSKEQFDAAQEAFEEVETPRGGLGVHFNESSCLGCHAPPSDRGLPGRGSPVTELRAGHLGGASEFIPAPGGTLITAKAVGEAIPEVNALPDRENVRDRFITPSL